MKKPKPMVTSGTPPDDEQGSFIDRNIPNKHKKTEMDIAQGRGPNTDTSASAEGPTSTTLIWMPRVSDIVS
jgi:hypothetical protein